MYARKLDNNNVDYYSYWFLFDKGNVRYLSILTIVLTYGMDSNVFIETTLNMYTISIYLGFAYLFNIDIRC
jgi:hypothetical protein